MVAQFNQIAFDILSRVAGIHMLDAYWMTLARPDNREVGLEKMLGKHLVHPGEEVLQAMVQIWMQVLLQSMSCV